MRTGWHKSRCNNWDSCKKRQKHRYPDIGTPVVISDFMELPMVGSYEGHYIIVKPGRYKVLDNFYEAHQALLFVEAGVRVWVDISDLKTVKGEQ